MKRVFMIWALAVLALAQSACGSGSRAGEGPSDSFTMVRPAVHEDAGYSGHAAEPDASVFYRNDEAWAQRIYADNHILATAYTQNGPIFAWSDGSISVGGTDQSVRRDEAFDPSGLVELAVTRSVCLVSGQDGVVRAYHLPRLEELWTSKKRTGRILAAGGGALWVESGDVAVLRGADTGAVAQSFPLETASVWVQPATNGDALYLALGGGRVVALRPEDGAVLWNATLGGVDYILCSDDAVWVLRADQVLELDPLDGSIRKRSELPALPLSRPFVNEQGLLCYKGADGYMYSSSAPQPDQRSVPPAVCETLSSYLLDSTLAAAGDTYLPFVDMAPHDGAYPFTVFQWFTPDNAAEFALEALEADGQTPASGAVLCVFDYDGNLLMSNVDDLGAHAVSVHSFNPSEGYYLALGTREDATRPLVLRVRLP
ncbi:MAG: PQQ-binding-like beta-propeller repeat protein [Spirochaetia bacterium]|nr:PQQ-binding-like beta-propeller repeat protein [Spirochaetia bacterium]